MKVSPITEIRDVPTAIWFSTLLLTYYKLSYRTGFHKQEVFWHQNEICNVASQILDGKKKVVPARICQNCNGNHEKSSFKFLKEHVNTSMLRLTARGEFYNFKETPVNLNRYNDLRFNITDDEEENFNYNVRCSELLEWFECVYCVRLNPSGRGPIHKKTKKDNSDDNIKTKFECIHPGTFKDRGY